MKKIFLLSILATMLLGACNTAYKSTATPDDVYYSPVTPAVAATEDKYESYASADDNYLRMKVHSRYQWSAIDDYSYWNNSLYDFGYSCSPSREVLLNPYNPYHGFGYNVYYRPWNYYTNPYTTIVYYKNPKVFYANSGKSNLTAYKNGNYNNSNRQSFGGLLKQVFTGTNNNGSSNYNNSSSSTSRTFNSGTTPSSNAGGRSGGFNSSGSSAGSSRPPR